jgi:hypothetical protein
MPVVPLFETPADPDAWHRVTAPGGYERWHFDAEDPARAVRVVAEFVEGADFNTDYLHRYRRYLRRPTRVQPPQAREYPCVQLSVYERGHVLGAEATHYRPDEFFGSEQRPDLRVGPSGFRRESGGSTRVEVRQQACSADLVFRPLFPHTPLQRSLLPPEAPDGEHYWIVAQPLCRVEGFARVAGSGAGLREIPVNGLGYHDHYFGTSPLGTGVVRRLWGRVLGEDRAVTFHVVTRTSRELPEEVQFLAIDAAGVQPVPVAAWNVEWGRRRSRGVVYPATITFGAQLRLTNPRLLHSNHQQLRLEYDAVGEGPDGTAFCEVHQPSPLAIRHRRRL